MGLRSVLLALLSIEPNSGYGVGRLLRNELGHLWDARLQQIYSELGKLQSGGLIRAERIDLPNRPAKKVYSLTPAGEAALDDWLTDPPAPASHKDDLLIRLLCVERMPRDLLRERLDERRQRCYAELARLRSLLRHTLRTGPARLGQLLTLDAAIARTKADAAWCAKAIERVTGLEPGADGAEKEEGGRRAAGA